MKNKGIILKSIAFILVVTLLAQVPNGTSIQAMTKANQTAHKALRKTLAEQKKNFCGEGSDTYLPYAFKDIDGDKIDELIIQPGFGYYSEGIFDYKNKKVVESVVVGQGFFTSFYTTNKVVYIHDSGHMGVLCDYYYKKNTKTNKYKLVAYVEKQYAEEDYAYDNDPVKTTYYKNNKKVSKATYTSYVKILKKDSKVVKHSALKWKKFYS